ncbi:hypothetical protein BDD43_0401 [Mucilaginibacter gracilis]|uniref:Histidine phosphatase superfamily protein (Branch 1) n=2 Tax=Mucilaginibacter gracilis TaxID=423350 RepID=A0A495IWA6_9SPHI|nr:hypothetical protein BDD43_0401 [Mucilaginibacter gracilis]
MFAALSQSSIAQSTTTAANLKIVLIRHGEKPLVGNNLNCKGLNRSRLLPAVITSKFGVPNFVYVPPMTLGNATLHSRMFQTVIPLVVKYNIAVNTTHDEHEYNEIAADLKTKTGLILVTWEHKAIPFITKALGIQLDNLTWPDDDFDSIWIVTFPNGVPTLTRDKEGLNPSDNCD